jgi:hypothetical protein
MLRDGPGNRAKSFRVSFHDVVPAGAMDVHIHETRHSGLAGRTKLLRARGQTHRGSRANCFNDSVSQQDTRIRNFRERSNGAPDVQQSRGHEQGDILAEIADWTKQNGRS